MRIDMTLPCQTLLDWAKDQQITPGTSETRLLPALLPGKLADRHAQVLRTRTEDRYCVLVKTEIAWKRNFRGWLCCSPPLPPTAFRGLDSERPFVSIEGYSEFEELYLTRNHGNGSYQVYFDLY